MPQYKAPLRDVRFQLNEVFDYAGHYAKQPNAEDASPDMVEAILEGCATFCEEMLAPLNLSGDHSWTGHSAFMLDEARVIHATGFHGAVTIEAFAEADARSLADGFEPAVFRRL